jgi:hypothetical protein
MVISFSSSDFVRAHRVPNQSVPRTVLDVVDRLNRNEYKRR